MKQQLTATGNCELNKFELNAPLIGEIDILHRIEFEKSPIKGKCKIISKQAFLGESKDILCLISITVNVNYTTTDNSSLTREGADKIVLWALGETRAFTIDILIKEGFDFADVIPSALDTFNTHKSTIVYPSFN
ncbi:MAG: hypothetical protein V4590_07970 [Bacteroidota bacterium]